MMARGARRPGGGFPGLRVPGLRFGKAAADGVVAEETPPDGEPARPAAANGTAPDEAAPNGTPAAEPPPELQAGSVPRWLQTSAAWSWRLLLLAAALYVAARVAALLYIVVVPCAAAILLTALLQPLTAPLRRRGMSPLAATWCILLLAIVLLGGAGWLVTTRVQADYPSLVTQFKHTTTQVQAWLAGPPFHLHTGSLQQLSNDVVKYLSQHKSAVEGTVVTGSRIVVELLAGVVLCFFVSFFLIKDGTRIWQWLTSRFQPERRRRANLAGAAAWQAVVYYVRGTVAVAAIHAVVIGVTLTIIGAPLVAPLALFMFLAAFVPLLGVLVAGAVALLVVLATKGWIAAIIVLIVMVVMNQLEGHLLQPQVVGKMVRLHPLAVILVLAVGAVVAGIAGAVVAVPITAAITRAARALRDDHGPG
ncbi:MAG: AI-2E family transporter [Trebonia sp.]|uniref:AI-2E family transporter n=1 Tax=Trebonia sp. TaxID=2767075 RepID=UPI003BAEDF48